MRTVNGKSNATSNPTMRQIVIERKSENMPKKPLNQKPRVSHTPGPWKILANAPDGDTWHITNYKGSYICGLDQYPSSLANSRLIAAAPELLEALKDIKASLSDLYSDHREIAGTYFGAVLAERINQAIAKAEAQ